MKKGFTLMELIVVVIIIGILAMVGLPQFFRVAERGRASEGIAALGAARTSQMNYASEHGLTATNVANLDSVLGNPRYFNALTLPAAAVDPSLAANAHATVATIIRRTGVGADNSGFGPYVLTIQVNGDITCTLGTAGICAVLGYPAT